ncbi:Ubiquitin fusion degradation protein 4 [Gryganskiella cystojenkinii]|nr:Ubiquitin fusion degradation protein 4 [Gryganskiella cystojenkinii]
MSQKKTALSKKAEKRASSTNNAAAPPVPAPTTASGPGPRADPETRRFLRRSTNTLTLSTSNQSQSQFSHHTRARATQPFPLMVPPTLSLDGDQPLIVDFLMDPFSSNNSKNTLESASPSSVPLSASSSSGRPKAQDTSARIITHTPPTQESAKRSRRQSGEFGPGLMQHPQQERDKQLSSLEFGQGAKTTRTTTTNGKNNKINSSSRKLKMAQTVPAALELFTSSASSSSSSSLMSAPGPDGSGHGAGYGTRLSRFVHTSNIQSSNRTHPLSSFTQASPASIPDSASSSNITSSSRPVPLTRHAITRHQSQVSPQAHQDFITFSFGIDGTLGVPTSTSSSAPSSAVGPTTSNPTTLSFSSSSSSSAVTRTKRKRVIFPLPTADQPLSHSQYQGRTRSKAPRLTDSSSSSQQDTVPTAAGVYSNTRRSSSRRTTSASNTLVFPFTQKSKMSTSQKVSNPHTKDIDQDTDKTESQDSSTPPAPAPLSDDSTLSQENGGNHEQSATENTASLVQSHDQVKDQVDAVAAAAENQTVDTSSDAAKSNKEDGDADHNEEEHEDDDEDEHHDDDDDDEDDEDDEAYNNHRQAEQDGLFSTSGSMGGMVTGVSSRLKSILTNLKAYEDPSLQLIALQDLAVLLSVSTEDTLAGYFSCDTFVKELVNLLKGTGDGDDNADIMLLACRCLSNLMEAMPASLGSVVYGGAVAALCEKLIVIQYIDLAEQSLTTLEKISSEYPHAVVKEGGLAAVLTYMDFFSTNVQRTAVKTAANCCRGMQHDSIEMVQQILPNLENIIQYSDQKIVEQACLCFVRLADSFRSNAAHLQSIITEPVLRAMLSLLSPNASVVVSPPVYTLLLHFVSTIAEHSPTLGFALLEMDVVDTLFLVLTGVHAPPAGVELQAPLRVPNIGSRSKEQISEILGIVTQLLPTLPKDDPLFDTEYRQLAAKQLEQKKRESNGEDVDMTPAQPETPSDKKRELLESHPTRVRRLGQILFPTLIEVYSSTVHYLIRQRAIQGLVKLAYFSSDEVLKTVLKDVEFASFLAVILSQQEHQSLVVAALQISDILMTKLPSVYHRYFEREGVIFEISKLAFLGVEKSLSTDLEKAVVVDQPVETPPCKPATDETVTTDSTESVAATPNTSTTSEPVSENGNDATQPAVSTSFTVSQRLVALMSDLRNMRDGEDGAQSVEDQLNAIQSELETACNQSSSALNPEAQQSSQASRAALDQLRMLHRLIVGGSRSVISAKTDEKGLGSGKTKGWIFERAKIIVDACETSNMDDQVKGNGSSVTVDLKRMAEGLRDAGASASAALTDLAGYLSHVGANGISSFEFLSSGLPRSLLEYLTTVDGSGSEGQEARVRRFIEAFMIPTSISSSSSSSQSSKATVSSPLSQLVKKMQESLTRMETFEVETAQTSLGERNNPSSSLATQVRLKLTPEEGTEVSQGLQNLIVSIHAIATFRTLDEYLRPRLKPTLAAPEKESITPKDTDGSEQKDPVPTATAPVTRRSSRLQKVTSQPGDTPIDTPECAPADISADNEIAESGLSESTQDNKGHSSDGSSDVSEGDIEEMDYELEGRSNTQNKGTDSSPVEVDADGFKPETPTKSGTDQTNGVADGSKALSAATSSTKSKMAPESSTPWHIQFSLHGTPLNTDMTVYGAIHDYERKNSRGSSAHRSFWSSVYPINYKRVDTPVPEQPMPAVNHDDEAVDLTLTSKMPKELSQQADYSPILGLLRVLHGINEDWSRFYGADDQLPSGTVQTLDALEFINSKISAKVSRQLEEPLIVASSSLPNWTVGLAKGFPFLFPFETRYTYLQSTSFGFSRSLMRWQNQQQRNGQADQRDDSQTFLGRVQRQKVRISRQKALESAVRVMELYGSHRAMLEVEYFEEVGTGLGPTLEFYSVVSKEFCKKSLKLWRYGDSESLTEYVSAPQGLFPRPMASSGTLDENDKKILQLFKSLGQFIAKAMLDSRIIDVPLSVLFVSQLQGRCLKPSLQLVKTIDPVLAMSLQSLQGFVKEKKRIYGLNLPSKERERALSNIDLDGTKLEDMSLDFTLPGYPEIKLKVGGDSIPVTIYNIDEYIQLTLEMTMGCGVETQVAAFKSGFNCVFSIQDLAGFRSEELVRLFGSGEEDWSFETLVDCVKADHGFTSESRAVRNLLRVMSEFTREERRQFLQFITGSPKLPIGGFKNLHPAFTVVCKPFEAPLKADDYLPSVMTCANYLKMPDYSCKEVTLAKFKMASEEGQGSFHLS